MATAMPPPVSGAVLRNVSWTTYEGLLADHEDSSAPRFTYDRGTLEIMSPLPEHEEHNRALASLVENVAVERRIRFRSLGSTTFRRADLGRGFEPDSCFDFRNAARMRGKTRIDLNVDPPPDLVIEIDVTQPSLDKLPIYAAFGMPEVWRYDGSRMVLLFLEGGTYREAEASLALPGITAIALSGLLRESPEMDRPEWILHVRDRARSLRDPAP